MGFAKEFREFVLRGNVIDLAVGVVIGTAFGKIVASFVADIAMPLINPAIPGGDWRALEVGPGVKLGTFIGTVVDFVIIAFSVFVVIKLLSRMKRKQDNAPATPAPLTTDQQLLTEIRDLMKERKL